MPNDDRPALGKHRLKANRAGPALTGLGAARVTIMPRKDHAALLPARRRLPRQRHHNSEGAVSRARARGGLENLLFF
jgi:hypothetical protein